MARKFLTAIDLVKNELQNAAVQNLASAPAAPVKGQLYFNSTGGDNTLYWWDGTAWISAKGGLQFGAVTAETTFGTSSANGVAATAARSDHTHGNPAHNNAAHSTINISALAAATADVSMGGFKLTNVADPTVATDAANKQYVDNSIAGLSWKESCRLGTTVNLASLSGPQTLDGIATSTGDRVLVKNQTTASQNGIYIAAPAAWARATDANTGTEINGLAVYVEEGTTLADTAWVCTTNAPITVDSTSLAFAQFAGGGSVTAGAGMTQSGNVLDVIAADASIVVAADNIKVGFAGTGSAVTAARSDHDHIGFYTRKYAGSTLAATSTPIGHGFNTRNVGVFVYRNSSPWDLIDCDVEMTDANTVTLRFNTAPALNEYNYVVVG